jgi:hypothetical protein
MPSTIVWLAVAVVAGALVGRALEHWSVVAGRVGRWLRDPVAAPPPSADPPHRRAHHPPGSRLRKSQ